MKDSFQTCHIPELDGIRGIAILSVLFYHLFWFPSPGGNWNGVPLAIWKVAQVGWVGVNIFFVLSGFLITRILLDQKKQANYFSRFYKRRILRIFPLYWLALGFIYFHYENSSPFVLVSVFFLSNISSVFGIVPCYPGLWSLSVEEQFYLFWPQVIKRCSFSKLRTVAILICIISSTLRGLSVMLPKFYWAFVTLGSFDGFAFGVLLAISYWETQSGKLALRSFSMRCFLILLLAVLFGSKCGILTRQKLLGEMFLPTLIYLASVALMAFCISERDSPKLKLLSKGFLPHWGRLSYAAYLCHYPVPEITNKLLSFYPGIYTHFFEFWFSVFQFGISFLITYLISLILHYFVEKPFLKLKDVNLIPKQSKSNSKIDSVINVLE
jgi:peptidoglycan/LPS O-acetylase OafA/YrhL